MKEAEQAYLHAEELLSAIQPGYPDNPAKVQLKNDLGLYWQEIGRIRLSKKNDPSGSEAAFNQSMELYSSLANTEPDNTEWQRNIGLNYAVIGDVRKQKNDWRGAEKSYAQSLRIFSALGVCRTQENIILYVFVITDNNVKPNVEV